MANPNETALKHAADCQARVYPYQPLRVMPEEIDESRCNCHVAELKRLQAELERAEVALEQIAFSAHMNGSDYPLRAQDYFDRKAKR